MKAELNSSSSSSSSSAQLLRSIEQLKTKLGTTRCIQGDRDTTVTHYELQTALKKLLLADLEYALDHKAEQDLWNTCFKCQITLMQANAKDKKIGVKQKEWQVTLHLFLDSALGFYTALLNQLCQMYDIDLPFRRKDGILFGSFGDENRPPTVVPSRSSCCYVVQDCLVHMGDIARYRGRMKQAESFYRHAVKLAPTSGQPYNQLALLEAHHGDRISPVYYYVRSLAVRTPFPAATTNLSKLYSRLAMQSPALEGRRQLSASEHTMLFLQLHARLQQGCEPRALRPLQAALAASLPRLLLTEALSPWRMLQMLVIGLQSAASCAGRPNGGAPLEPARLSEQQQRRLAAALEPAATALDALLRCSYRLEDSDQRRCWPLLPVVRLYICWLVESPQLLTTEPFTTRPQLWAHLCHLVNGMEVTAEMVTEAAENSLPLPEDVDLAGFLPLAGSQRGLCLSRPPVPAAAQAVVRAGRLRAACQRLSRAGVVWGAAPAGQLQAGYQTEPQLVLQQLQLAENGAETWPPSAGSEAGQDPSSPSEQSAPAGGEPAGPTVRSGQPPAEAKAGILKSEGGGTSRRRQNVALQALMKSGPRAAPAGDEPRFRESRQVTFRTPSPPAPTQPPATVPPRPSPTDNRPPRLCEPRRPPPAGPATAGVWPPPRPRHPLEDAPPAHFNPSVPPPGWSSAQPTPQPPQQQPAAPRQPLPPMAPPRDPLALPWGGWAAPTPAPQQPSPLAAMLSQVRCPAPGPGPGLGPGLGPGPGPGLGPGPGPALGLGSVPGPGPGSEPPGRRPDELGVYSLFPSAPAPELTARGAAYSLFPSAGMQHPLWPSAGPSPLERLIEQQRQQSRRGDP